jgi:hypothetical protein
MSDTGTAVERGMRRLYTLAFLHSVVEFSIWIVVLVVAFDRGGANSAGLAVAVQLLPAALLAPIVTAAGDRFARQKVLAVSFAVLAVTSAGLTVALFADLSLAVVYAAAALFTVALGATPSTIASLVVHHAGSPGLLIRANAAMISSIAAGSLVGPLVAAAVLSLAPAWVVTAAVATLCAATSLLVAWRQPVDDRPSTATTTARDVLADAVGGVAYVLGTPGLRWTVGVIALAGLVLGGLDIVFVAVAFERLDGSGDTTGVLAAAFAGGTLAAAITVGRRLRTSLATAAVVGALLLTIPVMLLGEPRRLAPAVALVVVLGVGKALFEIATRTLLQRACAETHTSRAFGALDSADLVASSIGAVLAGLLIADRDLTIALVAVGAGSAVALTAAAASLRRVERAAAPVRPEVVRALRSVPFLSPLPFPTLERLAAGLDVRTVPAGVCIVRQGDPGHEFFVLLAGTATVTVDGAPVDRLTAPSSFGEIALLHDEPRAATVDADASCELAVIARQPFLDALQRSVTGHQTALAVAARHRPPEAVPPENANG